MTTNNDVPTAPDSTGTPEQPVLADVDERTVEVGAAEDEETEADAGADEAQQ